MAGEGQGQQWQRKALWQFALHAAHETREE
jgi:hypothetical protein